MKIRTNEYDLVVNKKVDNKKILSISDIHYNKDILSDLLNKMHEIGPDYICIVGDLLDKTNDDLRDMVIWLNEISNSFKTIISIGNHDMVRYDKGNEYPWSTSINSNFFKLVDKISNVVYLRDVFESYSDGKVNFSALNMDSFWYENRDDRESKVEFYRVLSEIDCSKLKKSSLNILLSHSPNRLIKNNEIIVNKFEVLKYFDLILSGHNHGGLTPKILRPIMNHTGIVGPYNKVFQKSSYGTWTEENTSLLISDGITKCADSNKVKALKKVINSIYKPDIEIINIRQGDKHKLIKSSII